MLQSSSRVPALHRQSKSGLIATDCNCQPDDCADDQKEVDEISFVPQSRTEISAEDRASFEKFINMLNECDDVQDVNMRGVEEHPIKVLR